MQVLVKRLRRLTQAIFCGVSRILGRHRLTCARVPESVSGCGGEPESAKHCRLDLRDLIAGKNLTADAQDFLADRLEELVINHQMNDDQIVKWGLDAVSFSDEALLLRNHIPSEDWLVISSVLDTLRTKMKEMDLCAIDDDAWNPARQRAVSVARKANLSETKVTTKIASGLSFRGDVVKKQEVAVEMPM